MGDVVNDLNDFPNPTSAQIRALAGSVLLERIQWARQSGLTFGGARDEYEVLGYDRSISSKQYREEYARGGIAGRIVDALPNATWRGTFELIEDEDPKKDTTFEGAWRSLEKRLQIQAKFNRVDKLAGLSTFAALLIGAKGDTTSELPKATKPDDLLYLTPYSGGGGTSVGMNRNNASGMIADGDCSVYQIEDDTESPRFGLPKSYNIRRTSVADPSFGREVHWTRILHIAENLLDDEVNGAPTLERVWNLLADLRKVTGGGAEAFWLRANQGLHLDIDKDMQVGDAATQASSLKEQAEEYKHQLTRWLRTRGVDVKTLGSDVANFESPADAILTQIAGARGIPKRILTGSEMGELASSQDRDNWRDQVNGRQTGYAGPYIIRPLVNRLIEYGYLPTPMKGVDAYEVRWPQIQVLTEDEKVKGAAGWAGVNSAQGSIVFTEEEIRDHWHQLAPLTEEQRAEIAKRKAEGAEAEASAPGGPADPNTIADALVATNSKVIDEVDDLRAAGGKGSGIEGHTTPEKLDSYLRVKGGSFTSDDATSEAIVPHENGVAAGKTADGIVARLSTKGFSPSGAASPGHITLKGEGGTATIDVDKHHVVTARVVKTEKPALTIPKMPKNVEAYLSASRESLKGDEKQALEDGFEVATAEGFEGTLDDFYAEQIALYQHAAEGDPRLKTWFSAETLKGVPNDAATKAYIDGLIKGQKGKEAEKIGAKPGEKPVEANPGRGGKAEAKPKPGRSGKPAVEVKKSGGKSKSEKPKSGGTSGFDLTSILDDMDSDESDALKKGYETALARGFEGELTDFLAETYDKYTTESEEESTAEIWLSGKTIAAIKKLHTEPADKKSSQRSAIDNSELTDDDAEIVRMLQEAIDVGATEVIDAIVGQEARERVLSAERVELDDDVTNELREGTFTKFRLIEPRTAKHGQSYDFSSTQIQMPPHIAGALFEFSRKIPDEVLAEDGREDDAHITVKYGIHTSDVDDLRFVLADTRGIDIVLGEVRYFSGKDADALYTSVYSDDLHALNEKIAASVDVTDTHPTYTPHLMIAYVKKGIGERYEGDNTFVGMKAHVASILFSPAEGDSILLPLLGVERNLEGSAQAAPDVSSGGIADKKIKALGGLSGTQAQFVSLKADWLRVNDELFQYIDGELDSPEVRALIATQREIIKKMHRLEADPGGLEGIGMPGDLKDMLIIGAGPGGLAAAVMGGAEGLNPMIVEASGGHSGFPIGVTGEKLAADMTLQSERMGAEHVFNTSVTAIDYNAVTDLKTVTLSDGRTVQARSVIIAGLQTDFLPPYIRRDAKTGKVITSDVLETSMPGVFAVGDMRQKSIGRIGTTIGDGQFAVHSIFNYFSRLKKSGKAFQPVPQTIVLQSPTPRRVIKTVERDERGLISRIIENEE